MMVSDELLMYITHRYTPTDETPGYSMRDGWKNNPNAATVNSDSRHVPDKRGTRGAMDAVSSGYEDVQNRANANYVGIMIDAAYNYMNPFSE